MRSSIRLAWCVPLLAAAACGEITAPAEAPTAFRAVELDGAVTAAYTGFGFELWERLRAETPEENLFLSPTSAAIALAMTYNGAAGETRQAMARTLGVAGLPRERVNAANRAWLEALRDTQDPLAELAIANGIWARQGFSFLPSFLDRTREFYGAEVREVPFDAATLAAINRWVERSTRGRIDRILDEISGDDVMFLVNALYFKAQWSYRFAESGTGPGPFTRPDGRVVQASMMQQRVEVPYLRGDGFQMVALPYGNGRYSMVLALPERGSSVAAFSATLTPGRWAEWMRRMQRTEVGVILPRFRVESDRQLGDALSAMGMGVAFSDPGADFSEMTAARVFLGFVRQKSFVEVDEEGTEAAAVTVVGVRVVCGGCGPQYPVVQFDRPFFFAIQDNATGTVLFLGQVTDPTAG